VGRQRRDTYTQLLVSKTEVQKKMSYMAQPVPQYPSYQFNVLMHRLPNCVILESKSGSSLKFLDSQGRNGDNSLTIEKIKGDLGTGLCGSPSLSLSSIFVSFPLCFFHSES